MLVFVTLALADPNPADPVVDATCVQTVAERWEHHVALTVRRGEATLLHVADARDLTPRPNTLLDVLRVVPGAVAAPRGEWRIEGVAPTLVLDGATLARR